MRRRGRPGRRHSRPSSGRRSGAAARARRCRRFRFGRRSPRKVGVVAVLLRRGNATPQRRPGMARRRTAARFPSRPGGDPRRAALPSPGQRRRPGRFSLPRRPGLPARRSSSIAAASCSASRHSSTTGAAAPGCPQRSPELPALSRDSAERRVMGGGGRGPPRTQVGGCRQERAPLRRRGVQRRAGCMVPAPSPGAACERRAWLAASPARGAPDATRISGDPASEVPSIQGGTRGEGSPPGGAGEGRLLSPAVQPLLGSLALSQRRTR